MREHHNGTHLMRDELIIFVQVNVQMVVLLE